MDEKTNIVQSLHDDSVATLLGALARRRTEIEGAVDAAVKQRQELNLNVRELRAEKAQIDRLLRAAAGRKAKKA